jgi:hypothetical protein
MLRSAHVEAPLSRRIAPPRLPVASALTLAAFALALLT